MKYNFYAKCFKKILDIYIIMSNRSKNYNILFDELLNKSLPKRFKKRNKLTEQEFEELNFSNSQDLLDYEFNIPQLKKLNKKYNLKISGNKTQLLTRVYNYKYYSDQIIKIQKNWKIYIRIKFNKLHGPAYIKRNLCINDSDFFTLDLCKDIPYEQFFSFQDEDGFIYGFDLISIYNLFLKKNKRTLNPYTNKEFSPDILDNIKKIIKYNKLFKILLNLNINNNENENLISKQQLEMRVLSLFQVMDSLDNYTQINWLLDLDKRLLLRFIRELYDIWNYRANLSQNVKREICPPFGNPFRNININNLPNLSYSSLLKTILNILELIVKTGINRDSQILGTYYVLSALTLVNNSAAEAMPWLYQSVLAVA